MARLIVEAGGKARRFRLNEGEITIGSGEGATLTLPSAGLAELHADLVYSGDRAVLRLRRGVAPAVVGGVKRSGEITLEPGVAVRLGRASITLEGEDAPAPAAAAAPAQPGATRARVRRTQKRTIRKSMPSWLIVVLILSAVGVGYKIFESYSADAVERGFSVKASEYRIQEAIREENFAAIFEELELVDQQADLDPEWKKRFEEHRRKAQEMQADAEQRVRNVKGNPIWETQLQRFVDERLSTPNRPAARVFLKRIDQFRKDFPGHPQLGWCDRMADRFRAVAAMAEPPTFEDVAFEVKTLTWAMPRDYVQGFAILNDFVEDASPADRDKALALIDELEEQRVEYFDDRMQQAKYLWEGGQHGEAVEWLVQLVIKIGDEEMADDAARRIAASPGVEKALKGYRNDRPEVFAALMENEIVRKFAKTKGVL